MKKVAPAGGDDNRRNYLSPITTTNELERLDLRDWVEDLNVLEGLYFDLEKTWEKHKPGAKTNGSTWPQEVRGVNDLIDMLRRGAGNVIDKSFNTDSNSINIIMYDPVTRVRFLLAIDRNVPAQVRTMYPL